MHLLLTQLTIESTVIGLQEVRSFCFRDGILVSFPCIRVDEMGTVLVVPLDFFLTKQEHAAKNYLANTIWVLNLSIL